MKKTAGLLLALPLALGLAACGGDNRTNEEKIVDSVAEAMPASEMPTDEEIMETAQMTCDLLNEYGAETVIGNLYGDTSSKEMMEAGGTVIMQTFVDVLCPEYSDEVASYLK